MKKPLTRSETAAFLWRTAVLTSPRRLLLRPAIGTVPVSPGWPAGRPQRLRSDRSAPSRPPHRRPGGRWSPCVPGCGCRSQCTAAGRCVGAATELLADAMAGEQQYVLSNECWHDRGAWLPWRLAMPCSLLCVCCRTFCCMQGFGISSALLSLRLLPSGMRISDEVYRPMCFDAGQSACLFQLGAVAWDL